MTPVKSATFVGKAYIYGCFSWGLTTINDLQLRAVLSLLLLLSQPLRHFGVRRTPSLPLTLSLCGNSGWETQAWALQPQGGWLIGVPC